MKKYLVFIFSIFIFTTSSAKDLSEFFSNLIPGEGLTEVSIELTGEQDDDVDIQILGVRDISSDDSSNFFTQFSIFNTEVNNDYRLIANLGFGYRILTPDENFMFGLNSF